MILQALIFGVAATLLGLFMAALGETQPAYSILWWGFPFGTLLAAYLWGILGVRSLTKVVVVGFMAVAAFYLAALGPAIAAVVALMMQIHHASQTQLTMGSLIAGTIAGGIVSAGFLTALPWPRDNSRVYLEILLCAAAGGLLGAAGAMLENLAWLEYLPLGAVWHGGMGVVLALAAGMRPEESPADALSAEAG